MSDWPTVHLEEVARLQGGFAFKSKDWRDAGVPVVKIANVLDGRIALEGCSFVDEEVAATAARWRLHSEDILVGMTGYVGAVGRIRHHQLPALLNQRVGRFTPREPRVLDSDFLFFTLRQPRIRRFWESIASGSAQANISGKQLVSAEITLPPLTEQRRIAAVLGALDDKIELNRKMNATLEEMAQAIFKSWFIDFDGHDDLVESELGMIPRGWVPVTLGDLITLDKGLSYRSKFFDPSGLPMANLKCIRPSGGFRRTGLKYYGGEFKDKHLVSPGDVLIAMTDLTQKRVVIASPAIVPRVTGFDRILMSLDLTCARPRPDSGLTRLWLFHRLQTHDFKSFARGFANGTTVLHLKMDGVKRYRFPMPPSERIETFTALAESLVGRIGLCERESQTLAELRDTLLPKLISGEIRVPEAEEAVEAVV